MNFIFYFILASLAVDKEPACSCQANNSLPRPTLSDKTLFYIQRSPNPNTIVYDLNIKDGFINEEKPIHPYWIRYQEQGQKKELSYLQEHFAYGLKAKKINENQFEVKFVSYEKLLFSIQRSSRHHQFRAVANINGELIEINRIYLQIEGGSFWLPRVTCVQVTGVNPDTGNKVTQHFKPD